MKNWLTFIALALVLAVALQATRDARDVADSFAQHIAEVLHD